MAHVDLASSIKRKPRLMDLPVDTGFFFMHLAGFEPATDGLEIRCSIQLSYRCGAQSTLAALFETDKYFNESRHGSRRAAELHHNEAGLF